MHIPKNTSAYETLTTFQCQIPRPLFGLYFPVLVIEEVIDKHYLIVQGLKKKSIKKADQERFQLKRNIKSKSLAFLLKGFHTDLEHSITAKPFRYVLHIVLYVCEYLRMCVCTGRGNISNPSE